MELACESGDCGSSSKGQCKMRNLLHGKRLRGEKPFGQETTRVRFYYAAAGGRSARYQVSSTCSRLGKSMHRNCYSADAPGVLCFGSPQAALPSPCSAKGGVGARAAKPSPPESRSWPASRPRRKRHARRHVHTALAALASSSDQSWY
eukprot:1473539-Rhodomonas_salina.1